MFLVCLKDCVAKFSERIMENWLTAVLSSVIGKKKKSDHLYSIYNEYYTYPASCVHHVIRGSDMGRKLRFYNEIW